MSLDEGVSRFIGRMYEAVYDANAWRQIICELMERTDSRAAMLAFVDVRHQEYSKNAFFGPENTPFLTGIEEYAEEMHQADPSLEWAAQNPNAKVCNSASLMAPEDYRRHPYIVWNRSRFGSTHWRVFYTPPVDDLSFAMSLHPPASIGAAPASTEWLHRLLFEHMERALRLAARPPDVSSVLEAVFLLEESGKVLSMSPRAEQLLRKADGLSLNGRLLKANTAPAEAQLEKAISGTLQNRLTPQAEVSVRIRRRSGRPDWIAIITPCRSGLEHLPVPTASASLRIIETETRGSLLPCRAELFGFTPREMQVAEALLQGHSVESLSNLLKLRRNTARVHLQSLFRKTNTSRQSELVLLLSRLV